MSYDSQREKKFNEMNVDSGIIPGECTKYIQAPGWPNCMINGLVKMSINLLKVEI